MKVRNDWGRNFMAKFNTGGAVSSEPDAKLTPAMIISSIHVESAEKSTKAANRCSSRRVRQETVDSISSEKSYMQNKEEWDMKIADDSSLGANIDITRILHSMKRRKRSARQRIKSSEPWPQRLWALNSRKNVAIVHQNVQGVGVGSKNMKRNRGGTKFWCVNNREAKGKKHVGGENNDASNQSIPANSDEVMQCSTDTNATEHISVPNSDTPSLSKEQYSTYASEFAFKPSGASEISLEQTAILMNNTFLGFPKSKGAVADDLMATTDVISLYQDREKCTKFDAAIIPGLDLNDGAENFDTSTAESALASLCSLCAVSVPDSCVEFAVKVLKDETPLSAEVSKVDRFFMQMGYRQKSTIAGPSQSSQGSKG
ncbi:hypothetical protein HU200_004015 [Digitaria exilis]|uniref:Uncharacterized protein n=1 Tax=Digitaria exilis TaxID=1010633 RepID=A0A835FWX8_9POAL|nr:hypothetical protein HU200_041266 [Digitaria exilis]KAF8775980.1 hypothetical protein HU200_004015 [Digitaria exilis]CAB3456498.1 unnamed protein product [Digitaria exilis]